MKLKFVLICLIAAFCFSFVSNAQVLPANRSINWHLAGYKGSIPSYSTIVDISNFGGLGDGITNNDTALANAISSLSGANGVIYFAAGTYLFNSTANLPAGIILRGASSDSTTLKFDLSSGNNSDAIVIQGSVSATTTLLTNNAAKDSTTIYVADTAGFVTGDYIKLSFNDSSLLFSTWAYGTVGQIMKITSVNSNNITLESPLRMDYDISKNPKITKLNMISGVGLECFKIERADSTVGQSNNITFTCATQCWVSGVESYMCNFAHIAFNNSTNCSILGNYFHEAFAYGGGGQGYGVMCQVTTGECLIENNVFKHLRHSMILQSGANGNVYGYNYSINPYWAEQSLPSNSAGDMVLHGNYPYSNLFEGNIGQNIVIDNSHGINGPNNTFFRNRAELYGIFMNNSPASNDQNFIGNEITNSGFFLGLYMLNGTGNFEHGNNVNGTIHATGTATLNDSSYYCNSEPSFMQTQNNWPSIGIPNAINSGSNAAKNRYVVNSYTTCSPVITTGIKNLTTANNNEFNIFPNPTSNMVYITNSSNLSYPLNITICNTYGAIIGKHILTSPSQAIDLTTYSSGVYFVKMASASLTYGTQKLIVK